MHRIVTVLLVEDNDDLRELMRYFLEESYPDWQVLEAHNGVEGIEIARSALPDVIVVDFNMPLLDGYGMAVCLQKWPQTQRIPLILNSSETEDNPLLRQLRAMCRAVLRKPFSRRDVEAVFRHVLAQPNIV